MVTVAILNVFLSLYKYDLFSYFFIDNFFLKNSRNGRVLVSGGAWFALKIWEEKREREREIIGDSYTSRVEYIIRI